jgi:hypothetical protein
VPAEAARDVLFLDLFPRPAHSATLCAVAVSNREGGRTSLNSRDPTRRRRGDRTACSEAVPHHAAPAPVQVVRAERVLPAPAEPVHVRPPRTGAGAPSEAGRRIKGGRCSRPPHGRRLALVGVHRSTPVVTIGRHPIVARDHRPSSTGSRGQLGTSGSDWALNSPAFWPSESVFR